ncbi:glycoside hydrolase family 13 protein [Niabella drilacis]|uniref:Glycosidase n=1 Tax=Niabella drilacis (strain DSM 25811 / CCM 8410 / CCUG 62505 / LMG 26954 / E90) TaxID=1285928 RepID=A0A1G6LP88_NIADE|nr:glycoside hydrolase family 13 protein [Niabella drilacis]SDC45118.1 Glycosidase [Niabella drilacis]
MKKWILFLCMGMMLQFARAQYELYPTNWWVHMKWNQVQVLVRAPGKDLKTQTASVQYPGVKLEKVSRFENPHYMVLHLAIGPAARPGIVNIKIGKDVVQWPLGSRRTGNGTAFANGATSADLIYLIMPDRFSNGDPSNDRVPGMRDQSLNRDSVFERHGGDLKGVEDHLDYLKDLGVTAIWLNPVLENDMPDRTEHGYAFTNHYKIDPRIGGAPAYKSLVRAAHAKGIKMIQDAVYNHTGLEHVLFRDQPDSSWFHRWPKFTQTNYKDQAVFDPYGSKIDRKIMEDGWFVPSMPDWDQSNPFVQTFLIQHALWSVEEFGIDGWRVDTYAYNDLPFMNRCNQALYNEYPRISIFGETWVHGVPNQSYFCQNNYAIPFKSNLQATTDFQTLFYGIIPAVTQPFGWTEGVNKLYTTLAQDFVYKDPMRQVIFLDNHDLSRFYSVVNEDTAKYKLAFAWLLTGRGIPQMYYGSEVLMKGTTWPNDGYVRLDFPGGWKGDAQDKFTAAGRTEKENAVFDYIRALANYRKRSSAITSGKLLQFAPYDGVYVYFRYDDRQTIMCAMNTNNKLATIATSRFGEVLQRFRQGTDVVRGSRVALGDSLALQPMSNLVLELQ